MADWFMATYGPTMPAHVLPMARAAFEQQRLARGLDERLDGHRVSARTFEVPGDETGPASEITSSRRSRSLRVAECSTSMAEAW